MPDLMPDDARELSPVIRGAELVVLPGAGYLSCWEDPAAFNSTAWNVLDRGVGRTNSGTASPAFRKVLG
jgi:hypothetical protein